MSKMPSEGDGGNFRSECPENWYRGPGHRNIVERGRGRLLSLCRFQALRGVERPETELMGKPEQAVEALMLAPGPV